MREVAQLLEFPIGMPEELRAQVCRVLAEKDNEIKSLYKEIMSLESQLGKYNMALTYHECEELKSRVNIADFTVNSMGRELSKFHLRAKKVKVYNSPYPFEIMLEKISLKERFYSFIKRMIPWELKRKEIQ